MAALDVAPLVREALLRRDAARLPQLLGASEPVCFILAPAENEPAQDDKPAEPEPGEKPQARRFGSISLTFYPRVRLALFLRALCLGTLLCWMSAARSDSSSFESLLQQADAVRSADTTRFLALLKELDGQADQATELQRQHLRYLHTYRMALAGDFDSAIADLRRLFDETEDPTLKFRAGAFLVNNFAATREFAEGLAYAERVLDLLPQVPDRQTRQIGLVGAAVLYNQVGEYALALHQAELILAEPITGRTRCMAEFVRLEALFNRGDLAIDDEAISEHDQALRGAG